MSGAPATSPALHQAGLRPLLFGGILAVGAVSGLLVALSIGGFSIVADGAVLTTDGDLADAAIGRPSAPESTTGPAAAAGAGSVDDLNSDSVSATTASTIVPSTESARRLELWSANEAEVEPGNVELAAYGVFASRRVDTRLASFLVHDGMLITSAAAVAGRDTLWLRVAGRWEPTSVAMADPYTDVAVLQATESLPDDLASMLIEPEPVREGEPVAARLAPPDGASAPSGTLGYVGLSDQAVTTSLNRRCYVAFTTSLRYSAVPPGSALVDGDGAVIGMVIATPEPAAAAVPMTTVIEVATSMTEFGSPAPVWLGIEAGADGDGRTRVIDVEPTGPAAGVLAGDDIIVSIAGTTVENPDHLVHLVRRIPSDDGAAVVIERDGVNGSVHLRPSVVAPIR